MATLGPAAQETSSTAYIILAENQRKKKALQDTKVKCEQLLSENRLLLEEREANQQETYEVTEFLRKEILRKNEKIASLEAILEQREILVEQEKAAFIKHAEHKVNELKQQWGTRESELVEKVEYLNRELEALKDFRERQGEVETEMERLRDANEALVAAQEQTAAELERKFIEQNTKMKKEYEQKLEELKKSCEEDIDDRLDASVKRILQQNRRMAEELRLHVQETDELQRQKRLLEEERRTLLREVDIKSDLEQQYAAKGCKQRREIKDSEGRVAALEKSIGKLMADFEVERSRLQAHGSKEAAAARVESDGLRRLLKLKTRELANIRRLAQEVVRQRTDTETFLIDSLAFVREQLWHEEARQREAFHAGSGTLPPIHSSGYGEDTGVGQGQGPGTADSAGRERRVLVGKLDIRDLSWEDREKVLRLLFSKINHASQQTYFGNLPPHSFHQEDYGEFPPPPDGRATAGSPHSTLNRATPPDGHLSQAAPPPMA